MATTPQTIPDLKTAITAAIKATQWKYMRELSRTLPADPNVLAAPGTSFRAHFLSAS